MAATIHIDEYNGLAPGTKTASVTNLNVGAKDEANLAAVTANYVIAGTNSYNKYHKINFVDLGGAASVGEIRIWKSAGALKAGETLVTNLTTVGYSPATYSTPTRSTQSGNEMPTADPGTANLGIGGSLSGTLTDIGTSDLWTWQLQTTSSTPAGALNQKTFTIAWTET